MYQTQYGNSQYGSYSGHSQISSAVENNLAQVNPNCPKLLDTIQEISWYPLPNNQVFACATWDGMIRFYTFIFGQNGQYGVDFAQAINVHDPYILEQYHLKSAICCVFRPDGQKIYAGLANGNVIEVDLATKSIRTVGQHENGVRNIYWHQATNSLLTVGFDKYIRFWDVIQQNTRPQFEYKADNTPLVSAMFNNMFIFADNDQKLWTTDWEKLRNMGSSGSRSLFTSSISPLGDRSQITALSLSQNFIAFGSIDGRMSVQQIDRYQNKHIITFKAHKSEEQVDGYSQSKKTVMWPINGCEFNPVRAPNNWVYSTGSNGEMQLWDIEQKNKIKMVKAQGGYTASKLSPDGVVIAFGVGYDWHKGMEYMGKVQNQVGAYVIPNAELQYKL